MRATVTARWVQAALSCEPGEVVALTGPNGAGKTSLLRALAGLLPCVGSIEVRGREISHLPPHARRIGWVPQAPSLFGHLSVRDNAAYALRARGMSRAAAREHAQGWLGRLEVGHLAQARPGELSGGQAARVALARALAGNPELLLLDEPLSALDASAREGARRLLRRELAGGHASVLLVSHDAGDVAAIADRTLVLNRGVIVPAG